MTIASRVCRPTPRSLVCLRSFATTTQRPTTMAVSGEKTGHYNDWPNACGFDVRYEELEPTELQVSGHIPEYCAGVLFRNGLGPLSFETEKKNKTFRTNHWFDCLAQVHRFQIHASTATDPRVRVTHNSRRTCDGLMEQVMKTGDLSSITFAAKYEPCKTFFQKLQSVFTSANPLGNGRPDAVNVSVSLSINYPGLSKSGTRHQGSAAGHGSPPVANLINKTDTSTAQALDPETLEPLGLASQAVLHPDLKGPISGAHAKVCHRTGDVYNFNLNFGRTACYRPFHVSAATGKCEVLASIFAPAAYLHSSFLTEHYYILCVWNSRFAAGGLGMLWTRNFLDALNDLDGRQPATWYVVDRTPPSDGGRGVVAVYESDPFFAFHTINAYEEEQPSSSPQGEDSPRIDIVADLCAYNNLDVLKRFYIDNLRSDSTTARAYCDPKYDSARAHYRRFRLPGVNRQQNSSPPSAKDIKRAENVCSGAAGLAPELPTMNPSVRGRKHRYVWGVTDTGKSTFFDGLVKYDTETNAPCALWSMHGQSAGEPIFIADPTAQEGEEDKGVLLTAVLDGPAEKSYILVLDAKDLSEVGRATMAGPLLGFGFHGAHVKDHGNAAGGSDQPKL